MFSLLVPYKKKGKFKREDTSHLCTVVGGRNKIRGYVYRNSPTAYVNPVYPSEYSITNVRTLGVN